MIGQRLGDRKLASGQLGEQFGVVHQSDGVAGSSQVAGVERAIFDRVSAVNSWIVEGRHRTSYVPSWTVNVHVPDLPSRLSNPAPRGRPS